MQNIPSHFFKKGKEQTRWRDETGRFRKTPKFFRYAWGCKGIPVHGAYVSFTYFYWGFEEPDGEEKLLAHMEKCLKYDREDWWFNYYIGKGKVEVEYDESLDGTEEYEP